jgi:hypothetical protein
MAITVEFCTNTVSISTSEISLNTGTTSLNSNTANGVFQAFLDLNLLAAGDAFDFKVYETVRTSGTKRLAWSARFGNAQGTPIWVSPSLILGIGWDMTLTKVSGTDRSIPWRISQAA